MAFREQHGQGWSTVQSPAWHTFIYTELSGERSRTQLYRSLQCISWRRQVRTALIGTPSVPRPVRAFHEIHPTHLRHYAILQPSAFYWRSVGKCSASEQYKL